LNKKYVYTDLDIYLALSHIKGLVILPEELLKIYRCVSSGTNFTVTDVVAMQNIKNGTKEPVVNINSVLSIDNENLEKTINIKINDNLQTLIGLFQIYTYMMKTNYLFIGEGYSTELNTVKYGIQLDGRRKKIRIIDDNAQVGTEIDANAVDSGIGYFSDGQRKGRVMHSPDVDIDGPDHTYWCHYTGNAIAFHVDANKNTNFSVSSFWINSGSSDERLKDSIERIDENLLKVFDEVELIQFKFKNDEENKFRIGVIAQRLLEICKKYSVDVWKYDIVKAGITFPDDDNKYYAIDYTQLLLLKTKCLEIRDIKKQRQLDFLINKLNCKEELEEYMKEEI